MPCPARQQAYSSQAASRAADATEVLHIAADDHADDPRERYRCLTEAAGTLVAALASIGAAIAELPEDFDQVHTNERS